MPIEEVGLFKVTIIPLIKEAVRQIEYTVVALNKEEAVNLVSIYSLNVNFTVSVKRELVGYRQIKEK